MAVIYHIAFAQDWADAKQNGYYEHPSLKLEGFIHCSEVQQVAGVLERYFNGKSSLVKLSIDTEKLKSKLQYDPSPSTGEMFPHIYGVLNLDAVVDIVSL
ncbi:MAG: DUF952 domain-containing protein [Bacteroidetes bacterium]|nr:DUF952 domain-containing protein [Bacteroidota bacterium]